MKQSRNKIIFAGAAAFVFFLLVYYWDKVAGFISLIFNAAYSLLLGCAIAYVVNILMSFYEKHYFPRKDNAFVKKSKRPLCMIAAFLTLIVIIAFVICLVLPELVSCVTLLLSEVPDVIENLADMLEETGLFSQDLSKSLSDIDWKDVISNIIQILLSGVGSTVSVVADIASSVVNVLLGVIFSIYVLLGKERLQLQFNRLLKSYVKPNWNQKLHYVLSVMNNCFHRYIVGQCTEAVILGVLCAVGMLIFGFPYAVMTGAVIGVTALIPVAGAYIGGAVGFLLIFTVSPLKALLFLVYLVILQQLEGNLIYPRVVGASIGLPGIWVLTAVTIGGGICGITGMLFGVPLAASAYRLLRTDVRKREKIDTAQRC